MIIIIKINFENWVEDQMKKYYVLIIVTTGIFTITKKFPCNWVIPNRCTIYDLPKEAPPHFFRYNN